MTRQKRRNEKSEQTSLHEMPYSPHNSRLRENNKRPSHTRAKAQTERTIQAMSLIFFNTLSRKKENFNPITPGVVKLYTCGPTVYNFPTIGNFRTYVFEDVLRRWLKLSHYQVIQVMNLTDVDDKTIRGAREKQISLSEYTREYVDAFFEDLASLRIEQAEFFPRATDHIPEMVAIIRDLLKKEIAYRGDDGSIYFRVSKFPNYGKLAHIQVDELKVGARVRHDEYDKAEASDFALWKAWDPEDGDVFWETEIGKGRPGWHIECSAMSMKVLGPHFDIHTGGVDNIFPHHQNEIAQSEAYTGQAFVNYWLHAEHLIVDGRKMSKSLGNFYTVRDIFSKGFSPLALRYFYVTSHYRNKLNFSFEALQAAQSSIERIQDFLRRVSTAQGASFLELPQILKRTEKEFDEGMNDDLNTPRAVAAIHELINELNPHLERQALSKEDAALVSSLFLHVNQLFQIGLEDVLESTPPPPEIAALIAQREEARKSKDFRKADELRVALKNKGIVVEDTPLGPRWKNG